MHGWIKRESEILMDELIAVRRQIHQSPELSFKEYQTKEIVMEKLSLIPGMEIKEIDSIETAVVGILTNGEGPHIAVRADMDALPIKEEGCHSYRSKNDGVMHACGHDAHTSIILGVAKLVGKLMKQKEWTGTVTFIFQPAEEAADERGKTGAQYLVEAGVLEGVDMVLALHMSPEQQVGNVLIHDGYSMANVDVFEATIQGTGGHGAYPHLGTDPIWMLGPVLQSIHGIVARQISPLDPAVISIGEVKAGSASNIIPSEVYFQGTLRSYSPIVRDDLMKKLERAISVVEVLGGNYTFKANKGEPALYNNAIVNEQIRKSVQILYPEITIMDQPFGLGGEDFSHMTQAVKGAMFFLGCGMDDGIKRELHTSIFDIDESCLSIGVAILTQTIILGLS
ncbi:M20 family metallopeptidase [Niallia sp. JL1B1071]|uniref:M20 metallopeptidase family protein n=1 Tax=Niallia tiangongensis TaxID=3237105 RepID=UPI0037DC6EBC